MEAMALSHDVSCDFDRQKSDLSHDFLFDFYWPRRLHSGPMGTSQGDDKFVKKLDLLAALKTFQDEI